MPYPDDYMSATAADCFASPLAERASDAYAEAIEVGESFRAMAASLAAQVASRVREFAQRHEEYVGVEGPWPEIVRSVYDAITDAVAIKPPEAAQAEIMEEALDGLD